MKLEVVNNASVSDEFLKDEVYEVVQRHDRDVASGLIVTVVDCAPHLRAAA